MATSKKASTGKALTKGAVYQELATATGMTKKEVSAFFDALNTLVTNQLSKKGPGVINLPGLIKLYVKDKPATKATTKPDPFRPGEMMTVKAKPARRDVKARVLKTLKDAVK
jgi:nucleoid DNA-binding protein